MIKTSRQLKDLVRNRSNGNSAIAQVIIRNYIMERFLERVSLSEYKDHLVFKGGLMVSAIVGLDNRSTMDIDTTIKGIDLTADEVTEIIKEIIAIRLDDGISFQISSITSIMEEAEYPGIRASLEAYLDNMKTPLKIDFSTGDTVTPREIEYQYPLMFEKRSINILAYNVETIIAEKLETIITRSTANTRMRDFYDICILSDTVDINYDVLSAAYAATCKTRKTEQINQRRTEILEHIKSDAKLKELWENYQRKYHFAGEYTWYDVMSKLDMLITKVSHRNI